MSKLQFPIKLQAPISKTIWSLGFRIYLVIGIWSLGFTTWPALAGKPCDANKPNLVNPLTGDCGPISPFELFGRGIRVLLLLIGSLSLVFSIYGGFLWLTSGGNSERIQQGKDTLMWAILGVVVALFSYVILNFILNAILPVAS